ncbi:DNA helicase HerA, contains HAS-barrel and ATPase domains [Tessaracoccus bendigoensis DSM 12906]|uniref:DNA helicase HerA, contains HAS-barrel and ATPase domains n=1 Tax=Tessaracoccus bendigoensis DSM 12906 TaxID=1123357 RepID=A0A1M6KR12_9ACTN|nr:ATP-binding protein [Tessaracoccus bendigoensis]SHJ61375.1 DNA helicase HerA, contains HAS-barrel and ATPase domains [Tessaracoccus bendigoensis DSM 12906]
MNRHHWCVEALFHTSNSGLFSRRAGDRLLHVAAGLQPGDRIEVRLASTGDGIVAVTVSADTANPEIDPLMGWVWEDVARLESCTGQPRSSTPSSITEVLATRSDRKGNVWDQFQDWGAEPESTAGARLALWPVPSDVSGLGLLQALRSTRAEVCLHLAPVNDMAADMVAFELAASLPEQDLLVRSVYLGTPVAARLFVGHDASMSPRLRAALLARGAGLRLCTLPTDDRGTRDAWEGEALSLCAAALPFGAARCLTVTPAADTEAEVCGMQIVTPPARQVAIADEACREGLRLGSAMSSNGLAREVRLSVEDLLLHAEVVGSTGSGKSSLLAGLVRSAMDAGIGVSVLDPHGQLVDRLIAETPEAQAHAVTVVRSGDTEHPIPLNPLAGRDPELAADTLVSVLRDLHDPRNQGFLGPVWERWFGILIALQRAALGGRANLALLPELVADQRRLSRMAEALRESHQDLANDVRSIAARKPEDYAETTTWLTAKFQRMLGPVMRGILGSGRDAVDVVQVLDDAGALFLDLAAPEVGELGAQLLGEMWLTKHWEALSQRRDNTRPHLLIVDEAHLFASGLLPRLLTQARKYGVGVVLAHQNLEQLTPNLREAVLSSTNNVFVFRTGIREAGAAHERLGSWAGDSLTRLERLTAAVTVNTGSGFTAPFTLRVDHNDRAKASEAVGEGIERRSTSRFGLARPDEDRLSWSAFEDAVRRLNRPVPEPEPEGAGFLDEWLKRRAELTRSTAEESASTVRIPRP